MRVQICDVNHLILHINRFFIKLFRTNDIYVVTEWQINFHLQLPGVLYTLHVWVTAGVVRILLDIISFRLLLILLLLFIVLLLLCSALLFDFLCYQGTVANKCEYITLCGPQSYDMISVDDASALVALLCALYVRLTWLWIPHLSTIFLDENSCINFFDPNFLPFFRFSIMIISFTLILSV